jgi:hypothetical protein
MQPTKPPSFETVHKAAWHGLDDFLSEKLTVAEMIRQAAKKYADNLVYGHDAIVPEDLPRLDKEPFFESVITGLSNRHRDAMAAHIMATHEAAKDALAGKLALIADLERKRHDAIVKNSETASLLLAELKQAESEAQALRVQTQENPQVCKLQGTPATILAAARDNPYCLANPYALYTALAGLADDMPVSVWIGQDGLCNVS